MTGIRLAAPGAALIDATTGDRLTGAALESAVDAARDRAAALPDGMILAGVSPTIADVVDYLGALAAGRPIAPVDPGLPAATVRDWTQRFRPAFVRGLDLDPADGYTKDDGGWRRVGDAPAPHPDLAVLLATSGSTGDPKLVRLSSSGVVANARSIAAALAITPHDIAPTSLPLYYSYGLSVLNSHLTAGATVLLADGGVLAEPFWRAVDAFGATSLAGVPHHYRLLRRIDWRPARHPSLRTLTQAGGRLETERIVELAALADEADARLHVMYGQTEATARMTVLAADRLRDKPGSVGRAVDGGRIAVRTGSGALTTEPDVTGEIVYTGPNVMLGYARDAADLARGDETGGVLATGDVGRLDVDGDLWITGRTTRIGKVFGVRVDLDDVERIASGVGGTVAVTAGADRLVVWCDGGDAATIRAVRTRLKEALRLHGSGFDVRAVDGLPLLSSGKVDYRELEGTP